jgi:cytidine deaminase
MDNDNLIIEARRHVGEFALSEEWLTAGAVSAALVTVAGNLYTGICLDLACGIGFCAEHSAIAAMLASRETVITKIVAVTAEGILPPCGRCRELMLQVDRRNLQCEVILPGGDVQTLQELLPHNWLK